MDGRRIRKVVTEALAARRETVLDPDALRLEDLMTAASRLKHTDSSEAHRAAA
jgi:hypothetical protein